MDKYIGIGPAPCPFQFGTKQYHEWNETQEVKIVVTEDNRVFIKTPKTPVGGMRSSSNRTTGGKWKEINLRYKTPGHYLRQMNAKPADFAGGPRGVK